MVQVVQVVQMIHVVHVVQEVQVVQVVQLVWVVRIISLDDLHSENILFSWPKPSHYQENLIRHGCDRGRMNRGK